MAASYIIDVDHFAEEGLHSIVQNYESRLKSFQPNTKTSIFFVRICFIFLHSLLLNRYFFHTPIPLIRSNNTSSLRLALQNSFLRM